MVLPMLQRWTFGSLLVRQPKSPLDDMAFHVQYDENDIVDEVLIIKK